MTPFAPCLAIRVDAVQQALLSFTGIPLAEQLVMFNGARLDPARTLGSYGLPVVRGVATVSGGQKQKGATEAKLNGLFSSQRRPTM